VKTRQTLYAAASGAAYPFRDTVTGAVASV
jgi:hypothetical protein